MQPVSLPPAHNPALQIMLESLFQTGSKAGGQAGAAHNTPPPPVQSGADFLKNPPLAAPSMTASMSLEMLFEIVGAEERKTSLKSGTENLKAKADERKFVNARQQEEMWKNVSKDSGFFKTFARMIPGVGDMISANDKYNATMSQAALKDLEAADVKIGEATEMEQGHIEMVMNKYQDLLDKVNTLVKNHNTTLASIMGGERARNSDPA